MLFDLNTDKLLESISKDIGSCLCPVYHIVNANSMEEEYQLTPNRKWVPSLTRVKDGKVFNAESAIRGNLRRLERSKNSKYIVATHMEDLCQERKQ